MTSFYDLKRLRPKTNPIQTAIPVLIYLSLLLMNTRPCSAQDFAVNGSMHYQPPPANNEQYDSISYFPDSVVYIFNSTHIANADAQLTNPMHFKVSLPPDMRSKYAFGMESFGFLYDKRQTVYIYLDYNQASRADTSYRITQKLQIEELLVDRLNMINSKEMLNISANPYDKERETWLIKKGQATILLYNITKPQAGRFKNFAASFTFKNTSTLRK